MSQREGQHKTPAIQASDVTVTYRGGVTAVENLDLEVQKGTNLALIGPNGAGKTTLVKALATLLDPTSGDITINGHDISNRQAIRETIGYMPQSISVDEDLTGEQNIRYACSSQNVPKNQHDKRVESVLDVVGLKAAEDQRAETYSGGMKKRLDAATALVHKPDVLFLDEPTTGLDPRARRKLWSYLDTLKESTTIILTTQYLQEAEELCERVCIMQNAKIIADDSKQALKERVGSQTYKVSVDRIREAKNLARQITSSNVSVEDKKIVLHGANPHMLLTYLQSLKERGITVQQIHTQYPSLNDVFNTITEP